jgi:uncharacterized protein YjbI with pentapeptide repeats
MTRSGLRLNIAGVIIEFSSAVRTRETHAAFLETMGDGGLPPRSNRRAVALGPDWRNRWGARMANDRHVALLRRGGDVWNAWREKNPKTRPDLANADFSGVNLEPAQEMMDGVNLAEADLREADFSNANLYKACFYNADLRKANLSGAWLGDATLHEANLSEAELRSTYLGGAYLAGADLRGANLT